MKNSLLIGAIATLLTGAAIGIQATLNGRIGAVISPVRTGLWMNFVGGAIAGIIILFFVRGSESSSPISSPILAMLAIAGALGIVVITGVSFSLARTGVAAGLGGMVLGQFLVGLLVDTLGWGIGEAIPLSPTRILGLVLMTISVYIMLPRS